MKGLISGTLRSRLDSERMESEKKHFGIGARLGGAPKVESNRQQSMYDDMDDMMGGDDEHQLLNTTC